MSALFDNPETLCREIWRDGALVASIRLHRLVQLEGQEPAPTVVQFRPEHVWRSGWVIGDAKHVATSFAAAVAGEQPD